MATGVSIASGAGTSSSAGAQSRKPVKGAKVVIVGGGVGGASVAHHTKRMADILDVTLVEPKKTYTTCFFSNHYLGGYRTLKSLTHNYDGLTALGVNHVTQMASAVDTQAKQVRLDDGTQLPYDRLVLAPGIDLRYDAIEGYSPEAAEVMPHAWTSGAQAAALRAQLTAMEDGVISPIIISAGIVP